MKPRSGVTPGPRLPKDMNGREWAAFISDNGLQGSDEVKAFRPTWTGFSADPVGEISYLDFGAIVVLWNDTGGALTGTSNANTATITNLPLSLRPNNNALLSSFVIDDSGMYLGQISITPAGVLGLGLLTVAGILIQGGVGGLFTTSGQKGVPDGWIVMYAK